MHQYQSDTQMHHPSKPARRFFGITGTIVVLTVLPMLIVILLTTSSVEIGLGLIQDSIRTLRSQTVQSLDLLDTARRIEETMLKLQIENSKMLRLQRLELFSRRATELNKINVSHANMHREATALIDAVADFEERIAEHPSLLDAVNQRRLAYLHRASASIPRYLDYYGESQDRTLVLIQEGKFDRANVNFVFEGSGRLAVLEVVLGKITRATIGLLTSVSEGGVKRHMDDEAAIAGGISELSTRLYILLAAIAVLTLVLAFAYAHYRLVAPLNKLREAAQAVTDHSYTPGWLASLSVRRDDVGHLSRSFEAMVQRLRDLDEHRASSQRTARSPE